MKAAKKLCSLILMMFITISELKIQKVEVDDKEVTIETEDKTADFLTPLNKMLDIPEPTTANLDAKEEDVAEETDIVLNRRKDTLALNSLLQKSRIKVCCPKSLIEWQQKHKIETSQTFSDCVINVPEPETRLKTALLTIKCVDCVCAVCPFSNMKLFSF